MPYVHEWCDSFDSYGSGSGSDITPEAYSGVGTATISFEAGRTGNAIKMEATGLTSPFIERTLSANFAGLYITFAFKWSNGTDNTIVYFYAGSTEQFHIRFTSATNIRVVKGDGTTLGDITIPAVSLNTWYHFEIHVECNDTTGRVRLRMDDTEYGDLTGLDTNNGGGNFINKVRIGYTGNLSSHSFFFDDLVIQPSTGLFPLGPVSVHRLAPSAAGNANQFETEAGAGSSSNYTKVDDTPSNADADYIKANQQDQTDTYTMADLVPSVGTVIAVVGHIQGKVDVPTDKAPKHVVRVGGVDYDGATMQQMYNTYRNYQSAWVTNPAGGNWNIAAVNALEAGVQRS